MSIYNQRYLKIKRIGQGAFGKVYVVIDKEFKNQEKDLIIGEKKEKEFKEYVAIKKLKSKVYILKIKKNK